MKADHEQLLFRIKDDPIYHLGRCSVEYIGSYFMGYDDARRAWQQPEVPRPLDWEKFRTWQESKVHLCSQNLESFCRLLTDSHEAAFELYFVLYEGALKECAADLVDHRFEIKRVDLKRTTKTFTLIEFITNPEFQKLPAMYFGNRDWIGSLWAMCNGFLLAEKDMGVPDSSDAATLIGFQAWLDERHPIGKGRNWGQLIDFLAIGSNQRSLDNFYEELEMFRAGEDPDAPPRWVSEAVANVLKSTEGTQD